jgi:V/A-type H+-transporting ATPase subunit C
MTPLGTVRKEDIVKWINNKDSTGDADNTDNTGIPGLPPEISRAAVEAKGVLAKYKDPQKADIIIDKAILSAMHDNAFFQKVVCSRIDIENIKSLIRARHAGKDIEFFESLLNTGGYIETGKLVSVFPAGIREIAAFIRNTRYGYALESGLGELDAETRFHHFEKVCDDYMLTFINEANRVVFGIEPILGYVLEKENEITSIRLVMAAKMANSPASTVIERLRVHEW